MTIPLATERPCAVLKREHQIILRVLDVLENLLTRSEGQDLPTEPAGRCVEFFRLFADACHHAKEEDLLFPVLEQRGIPNEGGPIGVMLHEHRLGRAMVQKMAEALEHLEGGDVAAKADFQRAGRDYLHLLRQHISKEDNVLFMMGDQVMSNNDQAELTASFCDAGCRAFGGKRGDELEAMADDLEREWGPGA